MLHTLCVHEFKFLPLYERHTDRGEEGLMQLKTQMFLHSSTNIIAHTLQRMKNINHKSDAVEKISPILILSLWRAPTADKFKSRRTCDYDMRLTMTMYEIERKCWSIYDGIRMIFLYSHLHSRDWDDSRFLRFVKSKVWIILHFDLLSTINGREERALEKKKNPVTHNMST